MNWGAFILVFFIASSKFLFAASISLIYFSFWETILYISIGGIAGVSFFFFGAGYLMNIIHKRRLKKEEANRKNGIVIIKKVFTPFRRKVIRIKRRFGLNGIAFLTPCILSIPIGAIIAARFYHHKPQTVYVLYLSVIIWAFILTEFNDVIIWIFNHI